MTDLLSIQKGLLDWFCYEPVKLRSYESIRKLCLEIYPIKNAQDDNKKAIYQLLYPLLRSGLVEFYGNSNFRVSPTAGLLQQGKVLIYHPPLSLTERFHSILSGADIPCVALYQYTPEFIAWCFQNGISIQTFHIGRLLASLRPIHQIIADWEDDKIVDTTGYLYFNSYGRWVSNLSPNSHNVVAKKGSRHYAAKCLQLSDGRWKSIPGKKNQPDAFSLAVLYCQIQNEQELAITYDSRQGRISVRTPFFPLPIERLLFINTLFSRTNPDIFSNRTYFLDNRDFILLNKTFNRSIQSI